MKLYATTTSERASKGQGGNEYLNIDIMVYDKNNPLYQIEITADRLIFRERGYSEPLLERSHKDIRLQEGKRQSTCYCEKLSAPHMAIDCKKGEKKKGEVCECCGKPGKYCGACPIAHK